MLLVASYIFYGAWDWRFLFLLFNSTIIDYFCGLKIHEANNEKSKKLFLIFSVCSNLTILGFFKYFNFFASNLQNLLNYFGFNVHPHFLHIILPVGISFYTFQAMSYALDIYRGHVKPTKSFIDFALFVSFFPQLVAGPILRAEDFLPQVCSNRKVTKENIKCGLRLILWGLFIKIAVADRLAVYVDTVYKNVQHHSGVTFLVATFFFAFQIYCDFAGYSQIARGLAKMMGFNLMLNFRTPYLAKDIREFWQRWHISLSTWLRDYLYISLGGNRKGRISTYRNVMITMLLGGLWHGANWTFLVWGALHGIYIVVTRLVQETFKKILIIPRMLIMPGKILKIGLTFFLVLLTWVFFRAGSINEALYILKNIFTLTPGLFIGESRSLIINCFLAIIFIVLMEYRSRNDSEGDVLKCGNTIAQWAVYYLIIFGIILFGVNEGGQFIYFQF
jgi:D-alanyl-lipoteichoic acid acyltransferase DltB (MBOAT superfamily)